MFQVFRLIYLIASAKLHFNLVTALLFVHIKIQPLRSEARSLHPFDRGWI